ncbi:zinc-binding dehydrogenase [Streptomyces sp. M19]
MIGAGFMGHLHLAVAQHFQARSVAVVERDEERLAAIAAAGPDAAVTPDRLAEIPAADVVFVTIASRESIATALAAVADGGRIVLYGGSDGPPAELPGYEVHRRQLTVTGSFSHEPGDWREAAELLRGGAFAERLAPLVTARHPLAEVESALKQAAETPVYRVVVEP